MSSEKDDTVLIAAKASREFVERLDKQRERELFPSRSSFVIAVLTRYLDEADRKRRQQEQQGE